MFDKGNQAPPAPDYTPLIQASERAAARSEALSREQFDWAKQAYAENKATSDMVTERFLAQQDETSANARADRARYEQVFQPLEDSLAQEAQDYASPERRLKEQAKAIADVSQQFDAQRKNAERDLQAYGINPGAIKYAALDKGVRMQQAAASAGASTMAGERVDATGRALRSEAINVGRGYPGQIAGSYGTSQNAGTGAANTGLATTASGANTMGTGMQWGGMAQNSLNSAGNLMNTSHQNQMAQFNADQQASSGWGALAGAALGAGMSFMGAPAGSMAGRIGTRLFAAEGGAIPADASPSGGQAVDDVEARLTVGEFVIPKDVVRRKGVDFFEKLIAQSRNPKAKGEGKAPDKSGIPAPHLLPRTQVGALPMGR